MIPGMTGELRGDPQAVRDDRQLAPAAARLEVAGDRQGRRARVHDDALAVLDERRAGGTDPPLLVRLEALPDVERELGPAAIDARSLRRACAPGGRSDSSTTRSLRIVTAETWNCWRKVRDPSAPVLLDDPGDVLLPLTGEDVLRGGAGRSVTASPFPGTPGSGVRSGGFVWIARAQ